ncbi:type VI secretion system-associated FHA domain protein TagH [Variovorax rhizosphaerae]|uniref:Type VI secretion system-associated FHA domain protein TagH n=1 Tax=Variovorax rhizosphaerae TaxID=1836200 RepID=A0ABU8WJU1_9BURK
MIALRVTRRPGATVPDETALALPPKGLVIGRSVDCGLVLADPLRMVSRQHALVAAVGEGARVRCVSGHSPLWVNGTQVLPGGELPLAVGDRLRVGAFELAVETVAAPAAPRARLDRWFDLDSVNDPLASASPLPDLAPATPSAAEPSPPASRPASPAETSPAPPRASTSAWPSASTPASAYAAPAASPPSAMPAEAQSEGAGVSWQTSRLFVRTVTPGTPRPPATPPAAPPMQAVPVTPPPQAPAAAPRSPELHELAAAFSRGAGLGADVAPMTPEWMEHLGALLRETAEGTLALLKSRAVAKRHMRAEGTIIAPRQNNPLKFSPGATEALTRMLQREPSPGFLDPVAALKDAHHDLLVHQVAMVAGMRAAVFELFSRLSPEAAETMEGPAHGMTRRLPSLRAAALWQRHCTQHAQLLEHLDDDFETIFGREFVRAYEAQSRDDDDTNPSPLEPPWPPGR